MNLDPEKEKEIRAKIEKCLDEKNYGEAAQLIVAVAFVKADAKKLVELLLDAIATAQLEGRL